MTGQPRSMDWLKTGVALHGGIARDAFERLGGRELRAGERLGPYRIGEEIGRGGMGIVYAAERADGEFDQQVAIKWMPGGTGGADAAALFRRERQIQAQLRHPNIARLLDGGRTDDGMLWFAMERIEGLRLDHHLAAGHAPTFEARLAILAQVCAALAFAHGRGLVHRDLKPANVAIDCDAGVKLLDFGVALWTEQSPDVVRHACTPAWASPEQVRGEATGPASDIYQLGLLLRWLLADAKPAPGGLRARQLEAIAARATDPLAERRHASVAEFVRDLKAWQRQRPVGTGETPWMARLQLFLRRNALGSALAAGALLTLIALSLGFTWRLHQERDHAVEQATRANAAREFLVSLFRGADPTAHGGLDLTARDLLDRGEARIADELADQPVLRADLKETLASVYNYLAEHGRAETLIQASLAATPVTGSTAQERRDRARRLLVLASIFNRSARPADAIAPTDEALALVADDPAAEALELELGALNTRAMAFKHLGRGDEAAAALERLLARVGDSPAAAEHSAYAADNLAHLYEIRGRWADALAQAAVAETAFLALRGPESPEPWAVAGYRANLQYATGDLAGAHARYSDVLAAQQRIYAPEDRRIMNTRTSLARVALARDDLAGARTLLAAALSECERQFGPSHAECPLTWQLWGELRAREGESAEGIAALREAVALRQSGTNPVPRAVGLAKLALAGALCRGDGREEGSVLVDEAEASLRVSPPAPMDLHLLDATRETCRA